MNLYHSGSGRIWWCLSIRVSPFLRIFEEFLRQNYCIRLPCLVEKNRLRRKTGSYWSTSNGAIPNERSIQSKASDVMYDASGSRFIMSGNKNWNSIFHKLRVLFHIAKQSHFFNEPKRYQQKKPKMWARKNRWEFKRPLNKINRL